MENGILAQGKEEVEEWMVQLKNGGSISCTDPGENASGWSSLPGDCFTVRGPRYLADKVKIPGGDCLLKPLAFEWLKSGSRIDSVLENPNHRVTAALGRASKVGKGDPFVWAFNLQVPSKEHFSAISHFVTFNKFEDGSVWDRFLKGDDAYRNSHLKLIANISEGPWIVKTAVGEQAICILGRSLTCRYVQGPNFLEVDVDIGSSIVANAIVHLAIGYLSSLTVDMAFLIEGQSEEELPERILGTVRLKKLDLSAAVPVELLSKDATFVEGSSFQSRLWKSIGQGFSTFMQPGASLQNNSDDDAT